MGHIHSLSPLGMFLPSKRSPETLLHPMDRDTPPSPYLGVPGSAPPGDERDTLPSVQISVILTILPSWLLVIMRSSQLCHILPISTQTIYLISLSHTHIHTHALNQIQYSYYGQGQVQDFVQFTLNMRVVCKTSDLGLHYNFPSYAFLGGFIRLVLDEEQSNENAQLLGTSSPHQPCR